MATVLFDFDSTLVTCEGLELLLSNKLENDPAKQSLLHTISLQGLNGEIPLSESLKKRVELASPTQSEVKKLGTHLINMVTPGMQELIEWLHNQNTEVWIISGGIIESLLPVAELLRIPPANVLGVDLKWSKNGEFMGIDSQSLMAQSKLQGIQPHISSLSKPVIMIGDSSSDYSLYKEGIADHFILFTQHFQCTKLIALNTKQAHNTHELMLQLKGLIDENPPL